MVRFLARAVRDRERALRTDLVVGYGLQRLTLSRERSARIVADARRRYRRHNPGRRLVENEFYAELALSSRSGELAASEVRERLRHDPSVREALERMWPVLTPAQLLHDLFGGKALLRHARARPARRRRVAVAVPLARRLARRGRVDPRRRAAARRGPVAARPQAEAPPTR